MLTNTLGCKPTSRTVQNTPSTSAAVQSKPARVAGGWSAQARGAWAFRSRPDLSPPAVEVTTQTHNTAPGYIFVAPKAGVGQNGPMILDDQGQIVWFHPMHGKGVRAMNFKAQFYRGEPVLTWWQGKGGYGEFLILDSLYREIGRVRPGNGYPADLHEFLMTPQDTALLTAYNLVRTDLSSIGGPKNGVATDSIVQEIDMETGEVLFEWHSLDHVGLDESYERLPKDPRVGFDYFHLNSIDVDHDDNLLLSARNTFTVYKIDRKTGEIVWRLGGKKSDFEMGAGTRTAWQHDARRQPDGTITIFDNGSPRKDEKSYGLVLKLDMDRMTAILERKYAHPGKLLAATMANMQVLPGDHVFIGWGSEPLFSEFSSDGELLLDASFSDTKNESYRAFRFPWRGQPSEEPAIVAESGPRDEVRMYASWNGATEVATWEVLAGPSPGQLESVGSVARDGFETAMMMHTAEPYVAVQAKHRSGRVLGTSKVRRPRSFIGS